MVSWIVSKNSYKVGSIGKALSSMLRHGNNGEGPGTSSTGSVYAKSQLRCASNGSGCAISIRIQ